MASHHPPPPAPGGGPALVPGPPSAARRRRRLPWIVAAAAAAVLALVVAAVLVLRVFSTPYEVTGALCDEVDLTPVLAPAAAGDTNHRNVGDAWAAGEVCEYRFGRDSQAGSILRLTASSFSTSWAAGADYRRSIEFYEDFEFVPHDPFEVVEEAPGPWAQGTIYVGDVFASADYNVRLRVRDRNLSLQVDLILNGAEESRSFAADSEDAEAVRRVAENTLEALR